MQLRTLLYGEGIFETILWRGRTKKLYRHYERLRSSAQFFQIPCPDFESFCNFIEEKTENRKNLYVKFCLLSKGESLFYATPEQSEVLIIAKEYNPVKKPQRLCISNIKRHSSDPVIYHKTINYLQNILIKRQALKNGFDDAIILNERDEITECSSSNILLFKDDTFFTPYRECGLLLGTTLKTLMDKFEIKEAKIKIEDLFRYSAIFILNSLVGVLPVCKIIDKEFSYDENLINYLNSLIDEENSI
ncbi:MAG: aminotransferase class IV [Thermodesulfovibrio sp.]|uniref:aminotransferase class IV n=1 Tax=unclassified Thermodesulfovibrio TaxID=2645936 RepID=UPI00083A1126|nr:MULTISPECIES: aminotransferase class IV [unclassified Thermodesulfovibrio]MDI1471880.1 aminotransferase class IV [Thermodesulfovibrio sp. 1176]MDI6714951.1 aminotransferase class IV [Thermodesulfovibrio sp.]ODA44794.1 Aminodeoxychorismate lyase [Thermodesulfovibrio sp. N1]